MSYVVLTMTRLPINYQNALIYKIVCKNLDVKECYVGSTTDFRKRKWGHKYNCNNVKSKHYYLNVYNVKKVNTFFSIQQIQPRLEVQFAQAINL